MDEGAIYDPIDGFDLNEANRMFLSDEQKTSSTSSTSKERQKKKGVKLNNDSMPARMQVGYVMYPLQAKISRDHYSFIKFYCAVKGISLSKLIQEFVADGIKKIKKEGFTFPEANY